MEAGAMLSAVSRCRLHSCGTETVLKLFPRVQIVDRIARQSHNLPGSWLPTIKISGSYCLLQELQIFVCSTLFPIGPEDGMKSRNSWTVGQSITTISSSDITAL